MVREFCPRLVLSCCIRSYRETLVQELVEPYLKLSYILFVPMSNTPGRLLTKSHIRLLFFLPCSACAQYRFIERRNLSSIRLIKAHYSTMSSVSTTTLRTRLPNSALTHQYSQTSVSNRASRRYNIFSRLPLRRQTMQPQT